MDIDQKKIVKLIRACVDSKMKGVEKHSLSSLRSLAFGFTITPSPWEREIEYEIINSQNNKKAGYLIFGKGWGIDNLAMYCLMKLSSGTDLEIVKEKYNSKTTKILYNSQIIGECTVTDRISFMKIFNYDRKWDLIYKGELFGEINRGNIVTRNNLSINRPKGQSLPLIISKNRGFKTLFKKRQYDFIIPPDKEFNLSEDEVVFYIGVIIYFRCIFGFDIDNSC